MFRLYNLFLPHTNPGWTMYVDRLMRYWPSFIMAHKFHYLIKEWGIFLSDSAKNQFLVILKYLYNRDIILAYNYLFFLFANKRSIFYPNKILYWLISLLLFTNLLQIFYNIVYIMSTWILGTFSLINYW